ncbi:MAG: zinc-ribbon domain-containing protein, partial [Actinobacteria bacterium]|nr:zinc-ribbon domain-containing protein [Actinomycetota bacterium]
MKAPLSVTHPELAAEWHPGRNGNLTPALVTPGSGKKVWWRWRASPPHEWEAVIASRARGAGCARCSGQVATRTNSLAVLNRDVAAEWHPEKNVDLSPDDVTLGSGKKVWWQCRAVPPH